MKRILSIRLENESGALSRVVGLFSQRGYNIETITVAPTEDPSLSHMTIQTVGDEQTIEQIEKQLHKLIDVLRVTEIGQVPHIERELILIKLHTINNFIKEIKNIVEIFKGKIVDMTTDTFTIEISGTSSKIDAFINIIRKKAEIIDISRSGIVGIARS